MTNHWSSVMKVARAVEIPQALTTQLCSACVIWFLVLLLLFALAPAPCAASDDSDPQDYKFRIDAHWWIAKPTGTLQGDAGPIDFQKDFNFGDYNTFYGEVEWKPGRKHHLFFYIAPNQTSAQHVLTRQIEFNGQTFFANEKINAQLRSFIFSPGYEYDFISRKRGYFGLNFLVNLFDSNASISTLGGVSGPGGGTTTSRMASKSVFLPLPTGGPIFRYYIVPSRLYLHGSIQGMYFFGYGNFISASGFLGYAVTHHLSLRGGYLLGSRAEIHGTSSRLGISLTQKGPVVGLEGTW
jgi:hypothetical protein